MEGRPIDRSASASRSAGGLSSLERELDGLRADQAARLPERQLTIDDLAPPAPIELYGLQRLGASIEFSALLLDILRAHRWEVETTTAFAGEGVLVVARKPSIDGHFEVRRTGATVGEVAREIFDEAAVLEGAL